MIQELYAINRFECVKVTRDFFEFSKFHSSTHKTILIQSGTNQLTHGISMQVKLT